MLAQRVLGIRKFSEPRYELKPLRGRGFAENQGWRSPLKRLRYGQESVGLVLTPPPQLCPPVSRGGFKVGFNQSNGDSFDRGGAVKSFF